MKKNRIKCLFLDIGGVLLTNGWDKDARIRAAKNFKLDIGEMEDRHHLIFETFETGRLTLDEYLGSVIFYKKRHFTPRQFREFMFEQSAEYPEMIDLIVKLKKQYALKTAVVSNECRELNEYRIRKFRLDRFVDVFVSSCYVNLRKPEKEIYRLALDITQEPISQIVYIENTPMFVDVAESLGIRSILHKDFKSTRAKLSALGLKDTQ